MDEETGSTIERTVSASILSHYYDKFADKYAGRYPDVLNPPALINGITELLKKIGDGRIYDHTILYIVENDEDLLDPRHVRYVITVSNSGDDKTSYSVKLFYTQTGEMESISTFQDKKITWSPDTIDNTSHHTRTRYYLGFSYMLCDHSPGFDSMPKPEKELTGEELLALGVEGDLPPETISVGIGDNESNKSEAESEYDDLPWDVEDDTADEQQHEDDKIPDEDDTEVVINHEDEYDDDLETDFEELFD